MSNQRICSIAGQVSTWMCDGLWAGKPCQYETSQPGRLSLLPPCDGYMRISFRAELLLVNVVLQLPVWPQADWLGVKVLYSSDELGEHL